MQIFLIMLYRLRLADYNITDSNYCGEVNALRSRKADMTARNDEDVMVVAEYFLSDLSNDVLLNHILPYLSGDHRKALACTCHRMWELCYGQKYPWNHLRATIPDNATFNRLGYFMANWDEDKLHGLTSFSLALPLDSYTHGLNTALVVPSVTKLTLVLKPRARTLWVDNLLVDLYKIFPSIRDLSIEVHDVCEQGCGIKIMPNQKGSPWKLDKLSWSLCDLGKQAACDSNEVLHKLLTSTDSLVSLTLSAGANGLDEKPLDMSNMQSIVDLMDRFAKSLTYLDCRDAGYGFAHILGTKLTDLVALQVLKYRAVDKNQSALLGVLHGVGLSPNLRAITVAWHNVFSQHPPSFGNALLPLLGVCELEIQLTFLAREFNFPYAVPSVLLQNHPWIRDMDLVDGREMAGLVERFPDLEVLALTVRDGAAVQRKRYFKDGLLDFASTAVMLREMKFTGVNIPENMFAGLPFGNLQRWEFCGCQGISEAKIADVKAQNPRLSNCRFVIRPEANSVDRDSIFID